MNDLDKSGYGYQQTKVWLGPSLGWAMEHVQPAVTITDPGTYVVKPGDSLILIDCPGLVTIQLPDVRLWVQQPGYQPATAFKRSICVKDIGGNAENFDIVVAPFGTQRIDDIQQSILISTAFALVNLVPLIDLTGWTVQSNVGGGGGGGGGDVFKAGNNTFTGVNTFLNTITVPTMPAADSSTNAASTAFVKGQGYLTPPDLIPYAPLSSPTFINVPRAPTPSPGDNDTKLATTAFVQLALGNFQPLDADLTALSAVTGSNDIYYRSGTSVWSPVVIGANLTFTGGTLAATGGGGGAPTDAEYITSSIHAGLSAERVLTNTASITWDFSTPGQAKASTAAGGGNVSNSGAPTVGQYAKWVTATTIQGVAPATVLSDIGAQPAGSYQPLDADLTAIAALAGTNTIYYRSAADTWSAVTVSTGLSFSGGVLTCTVSTAGSQPLDATLTALAAYNTNGLLTQTAADTFTGRTLTGPAAGITVSNGNGVSGNPTLALADDLAALEGLAGTNTIYYRSGTDAWTAVTIGANLTFSGGTLSAAGAAAPSASGFTAHKSATQTISNSTWTKVDFGSTLYNNGSFFSTVNSRWTPPAGEVWFTASVWCDTLLVGSNLYIAIYKNGTILRFATGNTTNGTAFISCCDQANGTDYYEAWVFGYTSGGTFTIPTANNDATFFQGFMPVGPQGPVGPAGGAPTGAQYLVGLTDATLTAERLVTDTATITWDLATAGVAKANTANVLRTDVTSTIGVGYTFTANNLGSITSFTINPALGNYQYGTNNAAATWTAPASDCAVDILVTNGATAGAITFFGFTVGSNIGDGLTTTNGHKFIISIRRIAAVSTYTIKALQ